MVERDTNSVLGRRARPTCSTPQRMHPPHLCITMLLSQHSSRWRWKAEGCQKQVEALESWRQTSPETKPPSADSTKPGECGAALRLAL
jgi:hypothetical protein